MSDFARQLAELRARYAASLPAKLAELADLLAAARHGGPLDEPRAIAHRLAGTAGTYGLQGVSAAMAQLERAIDQLGGGSPASWAELEAFVATARAALAEVAP